MTVATAEKTTTREDSLSIKLLNLSERFGIIFVLIGIIILLTFLRPDVFPTWRNLTNITRQVSVLAVLALGQYIVIVTAGIDLSIGSVMALSMVTLAVGAREGLPWWVIIMIGPAVGIIAGWLNGILLTKFHFPHPFIVTLGTLNIARGLTNLVSGGAPISGLPDKVRVLGFNDVTLLTVGEDARKLPISLLVVVLLYFLTWVFMKHTRTGRHIFAIGGNPEAARVSGINIDRTLTLVYVLCGFAAGFAGLLLAGRTNSGFPNAGIGSELDAIAAVIIGGASFFGGRGTVMGVFAGVLITGLLRNGLNLMNVTVFWQQVAIGLVVLLAVYADVLRRRAGRTD